MAEELVCICQLIYMKTAYRSYIVIRSGIQAWTRASNIARSWGSVVVGCITVCWDFDTTDSRAGKTILRSRVRVLGSILGSTCVVRVEGAISTISLARSTMEEQ